MTNFKPLTSTGRCGECGSKVQRRVRMEPTGATCNRCGYTYELDGTPHGYRGSLKTRAEYEYAQARHIRMEFADYMGENA